MLPDKAQDLDHAGSAIGPKTHQVPEPSLRGRQYAIVVEDSNAMDIQWVSIGTGSEGWDLRRWDKNLVEVVTSALSGSGGRTGGVLTGGRALASSGGAVVEVEPVRQMHQ